VIQPSVDAAIDAPGPSTPPQARRASERVRTLLRTRSTTIALFVVIVGALLISVAHVRYFTSVSPVDGLMHIDYLYKAPHIVHDGEKVGQDAMREQACRGLMNWPSPGCSTTATYNAETFQEYGTNTAAIYTPFYYTLTKAVAAPLAATGGIGSLVTAGRLVSGLWLAGGLAMTFLVARRLGARPYVTAALLLAAAATPNVLLPSATVTPDAAAQLAGASMVWSVLWWEERPRRRYWLPVLIALAVVALKALNIIVVVLVALYLVLRALHRVLWPHAADAVDTIDAAGAAPRRTPSGLQTALCIVAISVVAMAGALGYILFTRATAVASTENVSMAQLVAASAFPRDGFITHFGVFLQVFYAPGWYVTVPLLGPIAQAVLGLVVFAGTFAAAFFVDRVPSLNRLLGVSLLVVGLVGAPLIIAFSYFASGVYVPIPGRYALTLVPAGIAVAASVIQRRSAQVVCIVGGLSCYLAVLGWLLTH